MLGRLLLLIPIVIIPSGNSMRPWAKHDKGAENVIFTPFLTEGSRNAPAVIISLETSGPQNHPRI
jgi:hypothetical protein